MGGSKTRCCPNGCYAAVGWGSKTRCCPNGCYAAVGWGAESKTSFASQP
ncbi:uncharacterized protein [Littorina saxatilis]